MGFFGVLFVVVEDGFEELERKFGEVAEHLEGLETLEK